VAARKSAHRLAEIAGLREMTIRKKRSSNVSQPSKLVVDIA
jgi:hypothetical protein